MAFKHNDMGRKVATLPLEAHSELSLLFGETGGNATAVGERLGVNKSTVTRWCVQLANRGYGDPRVIEAPKPTSEIPIDDVLSNKTGT